MTKLWKLGTWSQVPSIKMCQIMGFWDMSQDPASLVPLSFDIDCLTFGIRIYPWRRTWWRWQASSPKPWLPLLKRSGMRQMAATGGSLGLLSWPVSSVSTSVVEVKWRGWKLRPIWRSSIIRHSTSCKKKFTTACQKLKNNFRSLCFSST